MLLQKQQSDGFFKKGVMRNFEKFTRKHWRRNLFFNKVKLCRSANFIKNETLAQVFSCEFFRTLLIIDISIITCFTYVLSVVMVVISSVRPVITND